MLHRKAMVQLGWWQTNFRNHTAVLHPLDELNSVSDTALLQMKCPLKWRLTGSYVKNSLRDLPWNNECIHRVEGWFNRDACNVYRRKNTCNLCVSWVSFKDSSCSSFSCSNVFIWFCSICISWSFWLNTSSSITGACQIRKVQLGKRGHYYSYRWKMRKKNKKTKPKPSFVVKTCDQNCKVLKYVWHCLSGRYVDPTGYFFTFVSSIDFLLTSFFLSNRIMYP